MPVVIKGDELAPAPLPLPVQPPPGSPVPMAGQPPLPDQSHLHHRDVDQQIPGKSPVRISVQQSNQTASAGAGSDGGPAKPSGTVTGEVHPERIRNATMN